MRRALIAVALATFATPAMSQIDTDLKLEPDVDTYTTQTTMPAAPPRVADTGFYLVAAAAVASTAFDIQSTIDALDRCSRCREGNPIMKPVVDAGPVAMYAVGMAITGGLLWISYEMKKSHPESLNWLALPAVYTIGRTAVGFHNSSMPRN